jgi:small subunit ribosomal protein S8e
LNLTILIQLWAGITRDSLHKRRLTGGKRKIHRKKRKYDLGRQPAATKIGPKRIHLVRCRGGNIKHRALRLETGNYSWASECTFNILNGIVFSFLFRERE